MQAGSSAKWGAMDLDKQKLELERLTKKVGGKGKKIGGNSISATKVANRKSDYHGAAWKKQHGKWQVLASVVKGGSLLSLGVYHEDQQEARLYAPGPTPGTDVSAMCARRGLSKPDELRIRFDRQDI